MNFEPEKDSSNNFSADNYYLTIVDSNDNNNYEGSIYYDWIRNIVVNSGWCAVGEDKL